MSSSFSLTGLLSRLSLTTLPPATAATAATMPPRRLLSTSAALLAAKSSPAKSSSSKSSSAAAAAKPRRKHTAPRSENFLRIRTLKRNMFSPAPPPLRMARLRHLRHWTIHRAWMLFRRRQLEAIEKERSRMHFGMYNACEELRATAGPGGRGEGYLYRVAMEKKGVYGLNGVPIEYARYQTENPGKEPWNHDWKR
ncbi:hypothetical protein ESCO_002021 [Escovopsis weberi]|uniref:54S ribosomal protein L28 n=1 Tax=Escovopsis weberi TaxID=150374 RepID=A0A0M8N8S2_ESCWE|nr:hypothetical protein ESCO_002021 [Escovopsis weberi]